MRTRAKYITVQEARAGMELCVKIEIITQGRLYSLPEGHRLTVDNLFQLKAHRAEYIFVIEQDPRSDAQVAVDAARAAYRVMEIFAAADLTDSTTATLFNQVIIYRSA